MIAPGDFSVKKVSLNLFPKFIGKQLCQSLFFINVASSGPATLLKRDSRMDFILQISESY